MRLCRWHLAVVGVLIGLPAGGAAAQQRLHFRQPVTLRLLTVTVLDSEGLPVRGLDKRDFYLEERGVPCPIETFDEVSLDLPGARGVMGEGTAMVGDPEALEPLLVFAFDNLLSSHEAMIRAARAVEAFLSAHAGEGVRSMTVSLASTLRVLSMPGEADVKAVDLGPRTAYGDYVTLLRDLTIKTFDRQERRAMDLVTPLLTPLKRAAADREILFFAAQLSSLARLLDGVAGRKVVVVFTEGMEGTVGANRIVERAIADLSRQNISVHVVAVERGSVGLEAAFDTPLEYKLDTRPERLDLGTERDQLTHAIAYGTGGAFHRRPAGHLGPLLESILRQARSYYLLGYYLDRPGGVPSPTRSRPIEVHLVGKPSSWTLLYARAFLPEPPFERMDRQERAQRLLEHLLVDPLEHGEIPFEVRVDTLEGGDDAGRWDKVWLNLTLRIDSPSLFHRIAFGRRASTLEVAMVARDGRGTPLDAVIRTIYLRTRRGHGALHAAFRYEDVLRVGRTARDVRVVLRDARTGALGAVNVPVAIPPLERRGPALRALIIEERANPLMGLSPLVSSAAAAGPAGAIVSAGSGEAGDPLWRWRRHPLRAVEGVIVPDVDRIVGRGGRLDLFLQVSWPEAPRVVRRLQPRVTLTFVGPTPPPPWRRARELPLDVVAPLEVIGHDLAQLRGRLQLPADMPEGIYVLALEIRDPLTGDRLEGGQQISVVEYEAPGPAPLQSRMLVNPLRVPPGP